MEEKEIREYIRIGRDFMKGSRKSEAFKEEVKSDQDLKKPQPPLVKAAKEGNKIIDLPTNFNNLDINNDLLSVIYNRKSSRVFTEETISLLQLSYLLWATQGVKSIRGNNYATLRTVPCGGARHEYETYLVVQYVEDLKQGVYHYLPMEHKLEFVKELDDIKDSMNQSLCGQIWCTKSSVIFYWTLDAYRVEWRYGIQAHRPALIDVGHIGQNLYIGCSSLNLGVCGIASFEHDVCNKLFNLDGVNEFAVYTATVGTIKDSDYQKELDFYSFLNEE